MADISIGQRVTMVRGPWAGYSGEYLGTENTIVGVLHSVKLDNGHGSLVRRDAILVHHAPETQPRRIQRKSVRRRFRTQ